MRNSRRGKPSGLEFGGSGEDSFVAVVVTKLTGALLFILLLTMVIMALLPKAVDLGQALPVAGKDQPPVRIATPEALPDAVAGRPYLVALAAEGARGKTHWSIAGGPPKWLSLDRATGRIAGTPPSPTKEPLAFTVRVDDGAGADSLAVRLSVLPSATTDTAAPGALWTARLPVAVWRAWLEQGVGFLLLWLVHLLGLGLIANLERGAIGEEIAVEGVDAGRFKAQRRFGAYRAIVWLTTISATAALAAWLALAPAR